jgi:hypothetical protein
LSAGALSTNVTLGTAVDTAKTFVLAGYRSSGTGGDIGARMLRAQLTNSTTIQVDRSAAGDADDITEIAWQAIELNDGSAVQRGSASFNPGTISFGAASSTTGANVSTRSWSHTIGSGSNRKLVVGVAVEDAAGNQNVSSVTYNGVALSFATGVTVGTGTVGRVELWYLDEASLPAAGTYTVQVTMPGTVAEIDTGAISVAGARAGAPQVTATNTATTTNSITTNIATLTNNTWLFDAVVSGDTGSFTAGGGQTERWDRTTSTATGAASTKAVASAGATSMTQTFNATANRLAHVVAAVAPAYVSQTTATLTSINTSRSVAFVSTQPAGGQAIGRSGYTADDVLGVCAVTTTISSATQLTLERDSNVDTCDVGWFVIEFPVAPQPSVTRSGAWTTGSTHTVGAGNDRLLVFFVGYEHSSDPGVAGVTYGGQALTRGLGTVAGTTTVARVELWYLKESAITAASGTTFVVTWGGSTPTVPAYAAATYVNVDQTAPIYDSSSASTNGSTPNPITASVNIAAHATSIAGAISGNNGSYVWNNGWTEGTDQTAGGTMTLSSAEYAATTSGSSVASATHSGPNRQAIVAATLNPK